MNARTRRNRRNKSRNKRRVYLYKLISGCKYPGCEKKHDLTFHHTDKENKSFCIGNSYKLSWTKLKNEIKKCICLCRYHHDILEGYK